MENLDVDFYKIEDNELWNIVTNGPCVPMINIDGKVMEEIEEKYNQVNFVKLSKNY